MSEFAMAESDKCKSIITDYPIMYIYTLILPPTENGQGHL